MKGGFPVIREIKKKMVILNNRVPFQAEVKTYLKELELMDWIYMHLRLSGSGLSKENIDTIIHGGYVLDAKIEEHLLIDRLKELRSYLYRLTDMEADLSFTMIGDMHRIITGGNGETHFRKSHPVLLEYKYNPVMPSEIPSAMGELLAFAKKEDEFPDYILKAVKVHNKLIEIYPFKEGNEYLARAAMYYILIRKGYPLAAIQMSEQEYNDSVIAYLKKGDCGTLYKALMRAVYNRLELMIQLTSQSR